jgi:hypothetical protein
MKTTYLVELQTGYELSDNDRVRLQERIEENLRHLADEYLAQLVVATSHFVPGPNFQRSENKS